MNPRASDATNGPHLSPPFPGLRPFSYRDHEYFFGREEQISSLYRLLTRQHFIAVVGSSGSGKSSIVRAGLLPLLDQENAELPSPAWRWTAMRPGTSPIDRLADALAKTVKPRTDKFFSARRDRIVSILRSSRSGIAEALADTGIEPGAQLVILVDQFEELFRYINPAATVSDRVELAKRREVSTQFVQLLLEATRSHDSRIRVLITMRSDFIGDCARFRGLPEAVSAAQFLVPSLTRDQREEVIRKPLELAKATIDADLVERLLNDSSDELDQLPLLQHCLARLWTCALRSAPADVADNPAPETNQPPPGPCITEATYRDIGGLAGAISGHANEIYARLSESEAGVERVFQALAETDKDGRIIRRARTLAQLVEETGHPASEVSKILDAFRADECSFLVPPLSSNPTDALPPDTVIDVGHEALLRCWERVNGEPGATGERGDKRSVGWLRNEQQDGSHYQFLRSCLDPESPNEARLSANQTRRSWEWWERRKPNAAWASRYGGSFADVEHLVKQSFLSSRHARLRRVAISVFLVAVLGIAGMVALESYFEAQSTFRITAKLADSLSRGILDQFNNGTIKLAGAKELHDTSRELHDAINNRYKERDERAISETSDVVALRTAWLLTDADFADALQDRKTFQENVEQALKNAKSLVAKDPKNAEWQELLYESLFRQGDILLENYLNQGRNKSELLDAARAHYSEGHAVAEELSQITPDTFETADSTQSEERTFRIVFMTNKVGEALLVQGKYDEALAKFYDALDRARALEGSKKMARRLESAATLHKIASTLMQKQPHDYPKARELLSEAIDLEERARQDNPGNHIVMSNLAAAYSARANALLRDPQPPPNAADDAIKGYEKSELLLAALAKSDDSNMISVMKLADAQKRFGTVLRSLAAKDGAYADQARTEARSELNTRKQICQHEAGIEDSTEDLVKCRERVQVLSDFISR